MIVVVIASFVVNVIVVIQTRRDFVIVTIVVLSMRSGHISLWVIRMIVDVRHFLCRIMVMVAVMVIVMMMMIVFFPLSELDYCQQYKKQRPQPIDTIAASSAFLLQHGAI